MFYSLNMIVALATLLLSNGLAGFASPARRQLGPVGSLRPLAKLGKCIDVRANSLNNGTPVQIFDCDDNLTQDWRIQPGSTTIQISGTNVCLDAGSNPANGVKMKIWQCFDNLPAQQWVYNENDQIILKGTNFCLDLTNGNTDNSNQLQIWTCHSGNSNQIWVKRPPTFTGSPPKYLGRPLHPNGNPNKCLDVKGAVFANGTPIQIFDCNGSKAQKWTWTDGKTNVQLDGTRFCLDTTSANPANGVKMKIWECHFALPAQSWIYTSSQNLKLQTANECLDLTNGVTTNGNRLQVYQCSAGNHNQIWTSG